MRVWAIIQGSIPTLHAEVVALLPFLRAMTTHLLLMAGLTGAGKSTLAKALGDALGWPVIDKDVILFALLLCGVAEESAQSASYAAMLALGRELVAAQRRSVILDSPATWESTITAARAVRADAGASLRVVLCLADHDVRSRRVHAREAMRSQPAGVSRTMGTGVERFAHLTADAIHVSTEQPVEMAVAEVLARLGVGERRPSIPAGKPVHVELRVAQEADKPRVARLMQLYLYDLSVNTGTRPDADGRFAYPYRDAYWTDAGRAEGRIPFLVLADGELAGFALRTASSRLGHDGPTSDVAEFLVVRAWQRLGVGRAAERALFDLFPGRWEVAQLGANTPARALLANGDRRGHERRARRAHPRERALGPNGAGVLHPIRRLAQAQRVLQLGDEVVLAGDEHRQLAAEVGPEEVEWDRLTAVHRCLLRVTPALWRLVAGDVEEPAVVVLVPPVGMRVEERAPEPALQPHRPQPALLVRLA